MGRTTGARPWKVARIGTFAGARLSKGRRVTNARLPRVARRGSIGLHARMHLGFICPELSGHLNPMTTLGRALLKRGHRVTVIARPDARHKAEAAGLGFAAIGEREFPVGAMMAQSAELGRLSGIRAMQFTVEMLRRGATISLRDAPAVIAAEKIDALLVDQVTPAGATVAEQLGLPFVTVCNALAVNPDPAIPPGVLPWAYAPSVFGRARNVVGNALLHWLARPVIAEINRHRAVHDLTAVAGGLREGSMLAQIAQQPAFFDFPRSALPACFHYTGPWHDDASGDAVPFPWNLLDQRPLIYASMGTLQNRQQFIFAVIAAACATLDAQLVISLGSRDQDAGAVAAEFVGDPIVVAFAPQLELLDRAAFIITHAGLNTALEALAHGLPMVAIPITNDQPGVARPAQRGAAARCDRTRPRTSPLPKERAAPATGDRATRRAEARRRHRRTRARDGSASAARQRYFFGMIPLVSSLSILGRMTAWQ